MNKDEAGWLYLELKCPFVRLHTEMSVWDNESLELAKKMFEKFYREVELIIKKADDISISSGGK